MNKIILLIVVFINLNLVDIHASAIGCEMNNESVENTFSTEAVENLRSEELEKEQESIGSEQLPQNESDEENFQYNHLCSADTVSSLTITNIDENGNPIANSQFDILDVDQSYVTSGITDENGQFEIPEILDGDYYVKQIFVNQRYAPNNALLLVNVTGGTEATGQFVNSLARASITIEAQSNDGNPISNAKYDIVNNSNQVVRQIRTNSTGIAKANNLILGEYSVVENSVPKEYSNVSPRTQSVELTTNLQSEELLFTYETVKKNVDNENGGYVSIFSLATNGSPISGEEYEIYDSNGNLIETIVTNENGYAKSHKLDYGSYYIIKKGEPNTKYRFILNNSNRTVQYKIDNATADQNHGQLSIVVNNEDGIAVSGAQFELYDNNDNFIQEILTDKSGTAQIEQLEFGTYKLIQKSSMEGYSFNQNAMTLKIDSENNKVEITNQSSLVVDMSTNNNISIQSIEDNAQNTTYGNITLAETGSFLTILLILCSFLILLLIALRKFICDLLKG